MNKIRGDSVLTPVEILDLRHFGSPELRPLLEREATVWAQRMNWDYRSSAEMILRYLDSKILPGYAAVEDGRVVGYSFFIYEGSKGVIGDLFADSSVNNPAHLQEEMLGHVIETLQQSPGTQRVEAHARRLSRPSAFAADTPLSSGSIGSCASTPITSRAVVL